MKAIFFIVFLFGSVMLWAQNDTVRLNLAQYDSIKKFRIIGMTLHGASPHKDTILRVGTREYLPEEVAPWFLDYMLAKLSGESRTYVIRYDSSHVCMVYTDLEGKIGAYTEYYRNGNVKCRGQYCPLNGDRKYGTWFFYKEDGTLKRTKKFRGPKYCEGER